MTDRSERGHRAWACDAVHATRTLHGRWGFRYYSEPSLIRRLATGRLVSAIAHFRVVVFPVITASTGSDRIYNGDPDVALEMINSRTFDGRIQLLEYVPTVLDGPSGTDRTDP
jgi:hypothetical protein